MKLIRGFNHNWNRLLFRDLGIHFVCFLSVFLATLTLLPTLKWYLNARWSYDSVRVSKQHTGCQEVVQLLVKAPALSRGQEAKAAFRPSRELWRCWRTAREMCWVCYQNTLWPTVIGCEALAHGRGEPMRKPHVLRRLSRGCARKVPGKKTSSCIIVWWKEMCARCQLICLFS